MWDSRAEAETPPPSVITAGAVIAQNAGLAHGAACVVASTAGPDRWEAICCSQLAGVPRCTWSHNRGRPTGNICPLNRSVATSLTSESFTRAREYTTTPSAKLRPLGLPGRASARPIGAEDATVSRPWPKHRPACGALVEVHAGARRHRLRPLVPTLRTGDRCDQNHPASNAGPSARVPERPSRSRLLESTKTSGKIGLV